MPRAMAQPQHSRAGADAGGGPRASSDDHKFLPGVRRYRAQRLLPPMLQNQSNRFTEISEALFTRLPLAVGSGNLGAVRNVPRAIFLDNRRELIVHGPIVPYTTRHVISRISLETRFGSYHAGSIPNIARAKRRTSAISVSD